jgi:uncharacterized repeat protein (TIGR02543 family)
MKNFVKFDVRLPFMALFAAIMVIGLTGCPNPSDSGEITYTVSFDSKDGSAVDSQTVASGSTISKPADPALDGYVFDAWYIDENYATAWDFDTGTVTAAITLYAKWTQEFTVTFDTLGGSDVDSLTVTSGSAIAKPADPAYASHDFSGWYKEAAYATAWDFDTDTVTAATTLYAKWTGTSSLTITLPADFADLAAGIEIPAEITIYRISDDAAQKEATVTVTGDLSGDDITWLEGSKVKGAGSSVTFLAKDFALGTHHLSVEVIRDTIPWSKEFKLKVEETAPGTGE